MLHITNGDSAAELIRQTGLGGDVLAWRDILFDGPVPGAVPAAEFREVRARHLARQIDVTAEQIASDLEARDQQFEDLGRHDAVVLWFEHDLNDQTQLIQILDRSADLDLGKTTLELIAIDHFPGTHRFFGLGQLSVEQIASLYDQRQPVTPAQLDLARAAWAAFTSPDPTQIERVIEGDTSALPFLAAALRRHLQDFPWTRDGLSRTQRQILRAIEEGYQTPIGIFLSTQQVEEATYTGDTTLWHHLYTLAQEPNELVIRTNELPFLDFPNAVQSAFRDQTVRLTEQGKAVLAGEVDWLSLRSIDRWLGGVHLTPDSLWRWDDSSGRLVAG